MKMIIGGQKVDSSDGKTIDVINPATMEVIDSIPAATKGDIDTAIKNAQAGFEEWSAYPLHKRAEILKVSVRKMYENIDELATLIQREQGKPIMHARGEVATSAERTNTLVQSAILLEGKSIAGDNFPATTGNMIVTVRQPLGVVVAVIPFNFPLAELIANVVPALIMGNSVIIKPSTQTPLSGIRLTELFLESGVPANTIQIVTGSGSQIGGWLTSNDRIAAATMTGSTAVGSEIGANAVKNIKHISLELGGNDPLVILEDADLDYAAAEAVAGRLANCGQMCVGTKRCIVPNNHKDAFAAKLIDILKTKKVGDPTREDVDCGPLVSLKAAEQVEEQIALTVKQGGKVLYGGKRLEAAFHELTVLEAPKSADAAQDLEIFGPVWTIIGYDSQEEALEIANNTIYGLSSGVIGKDMETMMYFAKNLKAGACVVNGNGKFVGPNSPFGGWKKSGIGRRDAVSSLEEMSQVKVIVLRNCW